MTTKTKTRPEFIFLNRLREDGSINMFGASQVIAEVFDVNRREASKILTEWMQWVNNNPDNVNI